MGEKKLVRLFLAIVVTALMLSGCSDFFRPGNNDFSGGETLTPEELEQLSNQLTKDETAVPLNDLFYWTDSGSKIHLFADCGHLKNSSDIRSGSEETVRTLKKSGMCSSCLKKAEKTETDFDFFDVDITDYSKTSEEITSAVIVPFDGTFHWTESGSKVHLFSDCGHLKNSANIRSGDENAVRSLKKTGMCSACLNKAGKTDSDFRFFDSENKDISSDPFDNTSSIIIPFDSTFYWTESGSKVHLFSDCGHLKNSADIRSGDKNAVRSLKKTGMCSACLNKAGKTDAEFDLFNGETTSATIQSETATSAPEPNYNVTSSTLFYWTESGSKYHLFRDCGHIKNSTAVLSGTRLQLSIAGKNGPCTTCLTKAKLTQEEFLTMLK